LCGVDRTGRLADWFVDGSMVAPDSISAGIKMMHGYWI
jgi:hypothetical protein